MNEFKLLPDFAARIYTPQQSYPTSYNLYYGTDDNLFTYGKIIQHPFISDTQILIVGKTSNMASIITLDPLNYRVPTIPYPLPMYISEATFPNTQWGTVYEKVRQQLSKDGFSPYNAGWDAFNTTDKNVTFTYNSPIWQVQQLGVAGAPNLSHNFVLGTTYFRLYLVSTSMLLTQYKVSIPKPFIMVETYSPYALPHLTGAKNFSSLIGLSNRVDYTDLLNPAGEYVAPSANKILVLEKTDY